MKLLSFGEIIWDVFPDGKALGGAPLNFAAHAALLGAEAYLVSAVGNDDIGREAIKLISENGISTEMISVISGKETGKCTVTLDENAVPSYKIEDNTAYDYILSVTSDKSFDAVCFGTLSLRHENNRIVLEKLLKDYSFSEIVSDLNIRKPFASKESIEFCLNNSTIVKISDEELPFVTECIFDKAYLSDEDASIQISEKYKNIKLIVLTKGENGALCYDCAGKQFYYCKAEKVKVQSTVGAGDSFGAAFLTHYYKGKSLQDCLEFAAKVSAYVCSKKGAIPEDMSEFVKLI